ncbi:hypothetical protein JVU11DRAFT_11579 [Chiua virens]|nr:hypothetical protein JVU11DRAFT_11579 [Chiua virens]
MEPYPELIRKDVFLHSSDASWPTFVVEFDQFLRNEMKIPSWFNQNVSGVAHLDRLFASDDTSNDDLWDRADNHIDEQAEQRLRIMFNTALIDCARIRAVIEAEDLTDTSFPKESFLVILVRNAISEVYPGLSLLEDIPVVLPRHFSGQPIQILKYMKKRIYAPLVVSIVQEMPMPIEENQSDVGQQLSLEEDAHSESGPKPFEPPTLSEWLDACERPKTPEESEDEQEEGFLSSQFEAYFLAYPSSATPPSLCHIPVLCMADEDRLPVLMSSLLYQRRVWHISDPLIGVEFSKYDTTIRLYVGWFEGNPPSTRALPRVHIGEIRTPLRLDLSVPSVALVVSRFLYSLESHIRGVCNSIKHSVHGVISEMRSHLSFPWRIDTDLFQKEGPGSISESNNGRDMIIQWVESQKYSVSQASMVGSHKQDTTRSGSATSSVTPQHSNSTQSSYPIPASQVGSEGTTLSLPETREGAAQTTSKPSHQSYLPCSEFADTTKQTDYRMFRWMFDRRVVPQCIPIDLKFREEYSAVTGLIWPETWNSREDLPLVDAALEPCIEELLESVAVLKTQPGGVKCIPVDEFPVDLRVLEESFSAIFQASRRSDEKTRDQDNLPEMAWRHDHDRLLFDFFVRLVQPRKDDEAHTPIANFPIARFEDPLSRPTLETTLRLPRNDNLQMTSQGGLQMSILRMLRREVVDLEAWFCSAF